MASDKIPEELPGNHRKSDTQVWYHPLPLLHPSGVQILYPGDYFTKIISLHSLIYFSYTNWNYIFYGTNIKSESNLLYYREHGDPPWLLLQDCPQYRIAMVRTISARGGAERRRDSTRRSHPRAHLTPPCPQPGQPGRGDNFVDVKSDHIVFPFRIHVYEIYNPGGLASILAVCSISFVQCLWINVSIVMDSSFEAIIQAQLSSLMY